MTELDNKSFSIVPEISYLLKLNDSFERREREAQSEYRTPKHITCLKVSLEYTNVKVTKFYTMFDNSIDEQHKNKFLKRLPVTNGWEYGGTNTFSAFFFSPKHVGYKSPKKIRPFSHQIINH